MAQPLVTVVIPCYKQAHFLGEAIESVLAQTYPNFEIIVVDDGSPDNTPEVAGCYPNVRLIRQHNQGLSIARNTGIRESRGELLVCLDSDDRLCPGALEAGVACMAECPEAMLVYGRYRVILEDGRIVNPGSVLFAGDDLYKGLLVNNCIGMVAVVMYRRVVFDLLGGFDLEISPAADYDLYLRVAYSYQTQSHPAICADYRIYDDSMSGDLAIMLRAVMITLWRQKTVIKHRVDYQEAYHQGLKFWREYYGEGLYLRTAKGMWQLPRWRRTICDLSYLLRYYPQFLVVHGANRWRKLLNCIKKAL